MMSEWSQGWIASRPGPASPWAAGTRARRRALADEPYDGFRVARGVVLGLVLSVPAWIGVALLVRALLR